MENNNERFEYTYSASQQNEIERIRSKYMPQKEDKLAELKRLDEEVTRPGVIAGLVLGIVGTLIFGAGMSMTLVWTDTLLVAGVLVGIVGFVILGMAYPVYHKITEKQKAKIAPRILELTEQISRKQM